MATKRSEWTAEIRLHSTHAHALEASLACEDVSVRRDAQTLIVDVEGDSASDLRARFNSTLRSLRAADEALMSVGWGGARDD